MFVWSCASRHMAQSTVAQHIWLGLPQFHRRPISGGVWRWRLARPKDGVHATAISKPFDGGCARARASGRSGDRVIGRTGGDLGPTGTRRSRGVRSSQASCELLRLGFVGELNQASATAGGATAGSDSKPGITAAGRSSRSASQSSGRPSQPSRSTQPGEHSCARTAAGRTWRPAPGHRDPQCGYEHRPSVNENGESIEDQGAPPRITELEIRIADQGRVIAELHKRLG